MGVQTVSEPLAGTRQGFPSSFWSANLTELFERGAYYAMASFVVIYLGRLGMGDYYPSVLNGSVLWAMVYFLPILSGTIADQVGFRKALLTAFVLLAGGYLCMGFPVWFGGHVLTPVPSDKMTAGLGIWIPVILGIVLIGMGGSIVKPCIAGTVQKTAGARATLAFAIFYMVINIGSVAGRAVAFVVRRQFDLSWIFAVSLAFAVVAFFMVLFFYRDPDRETGAEVKPHKNPLTILADMFRVLGSGRFTIFLLVSSGFYFIYNQVYNVLPLYVSKVVEKNPAMDLYTMANPITIVCFQLLITKIFGKLRPIRAIVVGIVLIGLAMVINLWPLFQAGGVRALAMNWLPLGSLFIVLTVSFIAFGELFTASRTYEYIGSLAPKGQEGLFLGYANIPMAIGALIGGPVGALIFNKLMCHGATKRPDGLLELDPHYAAAGWLLLMGIGFASALSMWLYNRWLEKHPA